MRDPINNKTDLWSLLDDDADEVLEHKQQMARRKVKDRPKPGRVKETLAEELDQPEAEYDFTYKASDNEREWLGSILSEFYRDNLVSDVLSMVKGGKEANVYCCRAHPNIGAPLLAAKVYRPRLLRNLKNDALYKQGRELLDGDGKVIHDQRARRAITRGSRKGKEMSITSWIGHEHQALRELAEAGADVPRVVGYSGSAILMEFVGEEGLPAPTLHSASPGKEEAEKLFERLMWNVELMLSHDRIHADLSAFNVLYWDGQVKIIDFPQVVSPLENKNSRALLLRDIERLCRHFRRYGVQADASQLATGLWGRYLRGELGGRGRQVVD